jgi:5,10-methylenetetrahydrofolate reductase
VELDIPRGLDMSTVLEGAQFCYERKVDAVNITEGARARLRMSSVAISAMVEQRVGIETIMHRATRDHNLIGLQAEVLGAYALGIRNILVVTGDPAGIGDYPQANSVYDVDAVGLIRAVAAMNLGTDIMGNEIGMPTSFCISCAVNPCAEDLDVEIEKLERKVAAGAHIAFTQPLFEMKTLESFLKRIGHLKIPLMLGLIPLRSYKHADFLHNEVPGMRIPDKIRDDLRTAGAGAAALGVNIAQEFLREAKPAVAGAYIMPPFRKYHVIDELLSVL